MFLIKLHLAGSILCLLTFVGFCVVFKGTIKKNGWLDIESRWPLWKRAAGYLTLFVPVLNIIMLLGLFMMIGFTKEQVEESRKKEEAKA